MPDYRRYRVPGGTYCFTINLLERRANLLVWYIEPLREAVKCTRADRPIDAWVVLPDHMHCVDYVHFNPVKHGYVSVVAHWPHSTFHRWVKAGAYRRDYGAEGALDVAADERRR